MCVTNVIVGHPFQQAGLVPSRRRSDAGGQHAEVSLVDVQEEICCRAQFNLRAALVVLWKTRRQEDEQKLHQAGAAWTR